MDIYRVEDVPVEVALLRNDRLFLNDYVYAVDRAGRRQYYRNSLHDMAVVRCLMGSTREHGLAPDRDAVMRLRGASLPGVVTVLLDIPDVSRAVKGRPWPESFTQPTHYTPSEQDFAGHLIAYPHAYYFENNGWEYRAASGTLDG